ncbi:MULTISPECIES: glycosyltransferase family 39 protein [Chroococcidiopsis]|uniref:Glycosyltransferase RgtA/B/C/D-like domain-containing protein n=1 Tax=Chroococcidiopsis thermalis (strain PCC 7203) TaxID=251229 RepID=K9TXZ5_CHRTP|nr:MULTISPECIES: hypothetical protein [Chroococcidiopsis]AFY87440.1 hypothetical protein Chro_1929 [Chroococcidiopsis thermalis PCC 7203]
MNFTQRSWLQWLTLFGWIAIGTIIRFINLDAKPPWSDEFATLVFSLGNSFRTVPLDRAIALDTLLQPLQPRPSASFGDVFHNLMTESTHPPVYFLLNHLWLQLFPPDEGLVSLWAARAFSAILGVAAIPAIFGLCWLAFRSRLVGQIAAAMMAVSPYGIYQAQEPRHYTLAILVIIASLACLVVATRCLENRKPIPIWLVFTWVGTNTLGIAVHYFFTLTLCAEAIVLLAVVWKQFKIHNSQFPESTVRAGFGRRFIDISVNMLAKLAPTTSRLIAVAAGTTAGGLIWLPFLQSIPDNQMTDWIYRGNPFGSILESTARFLAWMISMLWLLPVEGVSQPIALVCGVIIVAFLFWTLPILISGWKIQLWRSRSRSGTQVVGGFVLVAIALFSIVTYALGADLSIASRYHFVYFPALIAIVSAALAICWDSNRLVQHTELNWTPRQQLRLKFLQTRGKVAVVLIWLLGLLGALTVVFNFGYQKIERPDRLVPIMQQGSQNPILIATAHYTRAQVRELMTLGWQFKHLYGSQVNSPLFLLAQHDRSSNRSVETLYKTIAELPKPLDLWVVNFTSARHDLEEGNNQICVPDSQRRAKVNGYRAKLFHCQ